jgi:hypothetical protein
MDYIEFPATDTVKTKAFYSQAFGWKFTDYGPDYTSFEDGRLAGGFNKELAVARRCAPRAAKSSRTPSHFPAAAGSTSRTPTATNSPSGPKNSHQGNCLRKRTSFWKSSGTSGTPYFIMAKRSTPIPNANPESRSAS